MRHPHSNTLTNIQERTIPNRRSSTVKRRIISGVLLTLIILSMIGLFTKNSNKANLTQQFTPSTIDTLQIPEPDTLTRSMVTLWNSNHHSAAYALAKGISDSLNPYFPSALYIRAAYALEKEQLSSAQTLFTQLLQYPQFNRIAQQWLPKITLEIDERDNLDRNASEHFYLKYEGAEAYPYRLSILKQLEFAYNTVSLKLRFYPQKKFQVIIFSSEKYSGVTALPDWVQATFDGKLRIPLQAVLKDSTAQKVYLHELTHAFLYQMNRSLPVWLHEGLALIIDNTPITPSILKESQWIPLERLHQPITLIQNKDQAILAYHISLALVKELLTLSYFETLPELCKTFNYIDPDQAFKSLYGISIEKLYSQTQNRWRPSHD